MLKLLVATSNPGKVREFNKLLKGLTDDLHLESYADLPQGGPDIEEPFLTFRENACHKALESAKILGISTLSDDSGLCVNALNGAPGVHSARYASLKRGVQIPRERRDAENIAELLNALKGKSNRAGYYVAVVAVALLVEDFVALFGEEKLRGLPHCEELPPNFDTFFRTGDFVIAAVAGRCHGQIIDKPRGTNGFGYDPIFEIDALGKTAAEVSIEVKNNVSHRRLASYALKELFKSMKAK